MTLINGNTSRAWLALQVTGLVSLGCLASPSPFAAQAQERQAGTVTQTTTQAHAPQAPSGPVIRSQVNVVLVDVRVWDKSGRSIRELKPEDFKIYEDGVLQTISSFSFEDVERLAVATPENNPPPAIDLGKLPTSVPSAQVIQGHRLIVLFFDLTSMPVDDLMRALKSAGDFVQKQLTPADLVAVAIYSSTLRIAQNFTNDRDALDRTLRSIAVGESSSLAEAGPQGEAGTTNASGQEVVAQDVSAAFTPDETEFNIFNTDQKLAALESLARLLREVPGRKSVIHFSSGIERTGIENQAQLRAASDAANRANVSLYTLDARGLAALPPGGDAFSASPAGTALYTGQAVASQVSALQGGRETLATLAADTGGRAFYDTNDFTAAFQEVQKENSSYYLLGYSPSKPRWDGKFHHLRVEVTRPGAKVVARPGYFAPKEFRQFTREDKELQLEQALDLDSPFVDLPMAVETASFCQPDNNFYVVLAAKIPGSAVSFLERSAVHRTEFDFVWRATDKAGHPVAVLRDTLPVKLDAGDYRQVLSGNILYEGGIVLPPGNYHLKVVARENESGKLGTFEEPLALFAVGDSGLALSSVVVSHQFREVTTGTKPGNPKGKEQNASPLELGGRSLLPSVTHVFRTDQKLYVYLESYGSVARELAGSKAPSPEFSGDTKNSVNRVPSPPPSVALVFFRGRVKISEAGPFAGKLEAGRKGKVLKAAHFVQIPLEKFPPGRYSMQVNILDPSNDRAAFVRVPMAITRAPLRAVAANPGN